MIEKHINIISSLDDLINQKKTIVKLERKIVFSDSDLDILKKINNNIVNKYIDLLKNTTDQETKQDLLDYLKTNKITLAKLTDKQSDWQIAIIKVESESSVDYYFNKSMDLSYGQQSENPRLKRTALLNAFLNYDLKNKVLKSTDLVWINNLLCGQDIDGYNGFYGQPITDIGFYDTRLPNKKTQDTTNDLDLYD